MRDRDRVGLVCHTTTLKRVENSGELVGTALLGPGRGFLTLSRTAAARRLDRSQLFGTPSAEVGVLLLCRSSAQEASMVDRLAGA